MAATLVSCMLAPAGAFAADSVHAGWVSIVPPILAIVLALILRQVLPALFAGVWVGAWAIEGGGLSGLGNGLLRAGDTYIVDALADSDHAAIIVFSMVIGGMVGVVSRNGGMQGIVARLVRWAGNARRAALATAGMGLAIFFDDYSNTLVVGNTMRPVTDRLKISREKLAYIVDSTAAPVCCIALVTTWIGFEVGLISDALQAAGSTLEPYSVFLNSIPFSFYPLLAIFFVLLVAATGRDFGPMLAAERRARGGDCCGIQASDNDLPLHDVVEPLPDRPVRAINALLPLLTLIIGVVVGLWVTGGGDGKTVADILAAADSYKALMWAAIASSLVAVVLSVAQRILTLEQAMNAWFIGVRSMLFAMLILILAWSLAGVTEALGTAQFLVEQIGSAIAPFLLPTLVFLVAAATAFSTGTSWGTMGVLMPLVVPLAWAISGGESAIVAGEGHVFYASIASVLAGAIWGDHCSPISDTTILSSMASGCDHVEHVRTQLPYATVVAAVAILFGSLPAGLGFAPWISLLLSMGVLLGTLFYLGERDESPAPGKPGPAPDKLAGIRSR